MCMKWNADDKVTHPQAKQLYQKELPPLSSAVPTPKQSSEIECRQMLDDFVFQQGDMGTALLAALTRYIKFCSYKMQPLSHEDQQEILQEVGLKLLHKHKQLTGNCSGWLFTIVRNEIVDQLRKQKSRPALLEPDNTGNLVEMQAEYPADVLHHRNLYHETECIEKVFDEIESQPTGGEDLSIYTRFAMGSSNAEIAEETGRTPGAIAKRISILRQRVRQLKQTLC